MLEKVLHHLASSHPDEVRRYELDFHMTSEMECPGTATGPSNTKDALVTWRVPRLPRGAQEGPLHGRRHPVRLSLVLDR